MDPKYLHCVALALIQVAAHGCSTDEPSRAERRVVFQKSALSEEDLPLSAAEYALLSVEVLNLTAQAWATTHAPPSAALLDPVFSAAGITQAQYDTYYSAHHSKVDAYLAAHPETQREIKRLERQIRASIGGSEQ